MAIALWQSCFLAAFLAACWSKLPAIRILQDHLQLAIFQVKPRTSVLLFNALHTIAGLSEGYFDLCCDWFNKNDVEPFHDHELERP